ncbi:MAG: carbohydrate ABC transporter permease [Lachnospiraceae bacterium]|nr:carbohydrate ABC transporter permease [Lachnospiraceae bacterium]
MTKQAKSKLHKTSAFDVINTSLVVLITLIVAYPLYFCIIASFSDPTQVSMGRTLLWVKDFTLEAYKYVFQEERLWVGYRNTIIYTVLGTLYNLILTIPAAYVLTKKYMPFQNILSWYYFITMYIGGGMIPDYLLRKELGLLNNPLVLIIGTGVSCYNLIVTRQYFASSIHPDIYEAAYIDGASEFKCFTSIAMPLAKPIIAVMTLYYGVDHWNSYYNALIYIRKEKYYPLQLVLRNILISNQNTSVDLNTDISVIEYLLQKQHMAQAMKYSIIFIASAPLLIIYPFIQKYFAKGVMIGSVKG